MYSLVAQALVFGSSSHRCAAAHSWRHLQFFTDIGRLDVAPWPVVYCARRTSVTKASRKIFGMARGDVGLAKK